jgi:enoyl-CoA hydratase/carnithine racemase
MTALLKARLPAATAHEAMVTGRRYGGPEAVAAGLADEAVPAGQVLTAAARRAGPLAGKPRETVAAIKRGLYAGTVAALENGAAADLGRLGRAAAAARGDGSGA